MFGAMTTSEWTDYRGTLEQLPRVGSEDGFIGTIFSYRRNPCDDVCTCWEGRELKVGAVWSDIMKVPVEDLMPMDELGLYASFG